MPRRPLTVYQSLVQSGEYQPDAAQANAIEALDGLWQSLLDSGKPSWWSRLLRRSAPVPAGVYLWGTVGRGKTWMMDLFHDCLPEGLGQRTHFHRFMSRVHAFLRSHDSARDPLPLLAKEWAARCRVLCFDEFFVSDIADAMLLAGLLDALFKEGVALVATSNQHPDDLYSDGLQRSRFMPAIALLKTHTRVVNVGGDTDYRLRILERAELFHQPLEAEAEAALDRRFREFSGGSELPSSLESNGRPFTAIKRGDGVVWFEFHELCERDRATMDYIEISRSFNTVLLSGVPVMDDRANDPARRFIHLVDEFYERNVKLLMTAAAPIEKLYTGERLAFEFQRTASRLVEMQSRDYLARPHLP